MMNPDPTDLVTSKEFLAAKGEPAKEALAAIEVGRQMFDRIKSGYARVASSDSVRPSLQCVRFEVSAEGVTVWATDSYALAVARIEDGAGFKYNRISEGAYVLAEQPEGRWALNAKDLVQALGRKPLKGSGGATIYFEAEGRATVVNRDGAATTLESYEGSAPKDPHTYVPETTDEDGLVGMFNPALLPAVVASIPRTESQGVSLRQPDSAALKPIAVECAGTTWGAIMPMR